MKQAPYSSHSERPIASKAKRPIVSKANAPTPAINEIGACLLHAPSVWDGQGC